jgi:hypothetical protein
VGGRAQLELVRSIYSAWERGDYRSDEWADPEIASRDKRSWRNARRRRALAESPIRVTVASAVVRR